MGRSCVTSIRLVSMVTAVMISLNARISEYDSSNRNKYAYIGPEKYAHNFTLRNTLTPFVKFPST